MSRVLVLGGGPDAERPVSVESASAVAEALRSAGHEVAERTIDGPGVDELASVAAEANAEVIFPALHGPWGEGGPMQAVLAGVGLPFVGSRERAARVAMDKLATKLIAASAGIRTAEACVVHAGETACAIGVPVVIKPVLEGSSVGLHVCRDDASLAEALRAVAADVRAHPSRVFMAERMVAGRELTVAVLDGAALPIVEVAPAEGVYDFAAKYERDDTGYVVAPELPAGVAEELGELSERLVGAIGAVHLCRVDFMLDSAGSAWVLEANTMPGFTGHSLFPLAAARAGLDLPSLCDRLVSLAVRDGAA